MEKIDIRRRNGQSQGWRNLIAFAGATLMTPYKGITVLSLPAAHSTTTHHQSAKPNVFLDKDWIKRSLMLVFQSLSAAVFLFLQATTLKKYPALMTHTLLSCLVETGIATITAAILDHKISSWRLSWNMTRVAPLFGGIMIFGIIVYIHMLVIRKKGPVFVSAFKPLSTLTVAVMGLIIVGEALHLGGLVGATLIILGLYAILWRKEEEKHQKFSEHSTTDDHRTVIKPEK